MKIRSVIFIFIWVSSLLWATPEEDFLMALRDSRLQDARFFLEADNSVDTLLEGNSTALIIMCKEQRSREVRWLIEQGADPDMKDPEGYTPLMHAAMNGDRNLIQILLAGHASLNLQSDLGMTALQLAINHCEIETARYLEDRGGRIIEGYFDHPALSEVWTRRQFFQRALALKETRWKNYDFLNIVLNGTYRDLKIALDTGVNPDAADTEDVTALMLSLSLDTIFAMELLLDRGADLQLRDSMGHNALWYAAYANNIPALEILIESGLKDDAEYLELSATFGAFSDGAYDALVFLLRQGWNPDQGGRMGASLVHYAALQGDLRTLTELQKAGASLSMSDGRGKTALDYLIQGYHLKGDENHYIPSAQFLKDADVQATLSPSVLDNVKLSRIIYSKY